MARHEYIGMCGKWTRTEGRKSIPNGGWIRYVGRGNRVYSGIGVGSAGIELGKMGSAGSRNLD